MSNNFLAPFHHDVILVGEDDGLVLADFPRDFFYFPPATAQILVGWESKPAPAKELKIYRIVETGKYNNFFGFDHREVEDHRLQRNQIRSYFDLPNRELTLGKRGTFFVTTIDGEPVKEDFSNAFVVFAQARIKQTIFSLCPFNAGYKCFATSQNRVALNHRLP